MRGGADPPAPSSSSPGGPNIICSDVREEENGRNIDELDMFGCWRDMRKRELLIEEGGESRVAGAEWRLRFDGNGGSKTRSSAKREPVLIARSVGVKVTVLAFASNTLLGESTMADAEIVLLVSMDKGILEFEGTGSTCAASSSREASVRSAIGTTAGLGSYSLLSVRPDDEVERRDVIRDSIEEERSDESEAWGWGVIGFLEWGPLELLKRLPL